MKSIAYFPAFTARNSRQPLSAFLSSLSNFGITAQENSYDSDAAVIWSVLWNGSMLGNQKVYQHYRSLNKPVIIIDVGTLKRNITWKIAVDNITRYGYYGHLSQQDRMRPQKLGIELSDRIVKNHSILIAAQHAMSLQVHDLSSIEDWINNTIKLLSNYTDRPIVVRSHPRAKLNMTLLPDVPIQTPQKILNSYDNFDFSLDYHAVINYNSGPGILAALGGCNIVVDVSSLAYDVSCKMSEIDNPPKIDRQQWLIDIAHTEYTVEEIGQGLWFHRLKEKLIEYDH